MRVALPDATVFAPTLSPNPEEDIQQLISMLNGSAKPSLLVGTSLGGFYTLYLSCVYGHPCMAINPAWKAYLTLRKKVGNQTRYDNAYPYVFLPEYIDKLTEMYDRMSSIEKNGTLLNIYLSMDDEESVSRR